MLLLTVVGGACLAAPAPAPAPLTPSPTPQPPATPSPLANLRSGGLWVLVGGVLLNVARQLAKYVWRHVVKEVTTTVEIPFQDPSHRWVAEWLKRHEYSRRAVSLSVTTTEDPRGRHVIDFMPAPGHHLLLYRGRPVWLARDVQEQAGQGAPAGGARGPPEKLRLTTLGRNRELISRLIHEAMELAVERERQTTVVHVNGGYGTWARSSERPRRPLGSVILDEGVGERLLGDLRSFLDDSEWYSRCGIPHRRGYLLYGRPGCGKSSFISAVAGALGLNIYVVGLGSQTISDEDLLSLLASTPKQCILLLEDVDAAFRPGDGRAVAGEKSSLTFSGVLNAIDGVGAQEGRVLFMTTNHPERLDPALVRPGRIDVRVEFSYASAHQARALFARFFGGEGDADLFAERLGDGACSMATLQGYLLRHRSDPAAAVENAGSLRNENFTL